jgi:hypothetical protein
MTSRMKIIRLVKIKLDGLHCPCESSSALCKHIESILHKREVPDYVFEFYPKFKLIVAKYYRGNLLEELEKEKDNMLSDNCGFCVHSLNDSHVKERDSYIMCNKCYKLAHKVCYYKSNPEKNGCMYCRQ